MNKNEKLLKTKVIQVNKQIAYFKNLLNYEDLEKPLSYMQQ